jgi:glutaredoxin
VNLIQHDIEKDKSKRDEMIEKSGRTGIPFIDIEGIYIYGANLQGIKKAVEKRRSQAE